MPTAETPYDKGLCRSSESSGFPWIQKTVTRETMVRPRNMVAIDVGQQSVRVVQGLQDSARLETWQATNFTASKVTPPFNKAITGRPDCDPVDPADIIYPPSLIEQEARQAAEAEQARREQEQFQERLIS